MLCPQKFRRHELFLSVCYLECCCNVFLSNNKDSYFYFLLYLIVWLSFLTSTHLWWVHFSKDVVQKDLGIGIWLWNLLLSSKKTSGFGFPPSTSDTWCSLSTTNENDFATHWIQLATHKSLHKNLTGKSGWEFTRLQGCLQNCKFVYLFAISKAVFTQTTPTQVTKTKRKQNKAALRNWNVCGMAMLVCAGLKTLISQS